MRWIVADDKNLDSFPAYARHLFSQQMTSPQVQHDLEMLLSMEIKIRLLETEGLQLPANPPPRPPPPQNLNFSFMNLWHQRPSMSMCNSVR